jgi:hypothetical protein
MLLTRRVVVTNILESSLLSNRPEKQMVVGSLSVYIRDAVLVSTR